MRITSRDKRLLFQLSQRYRQSHSVLGKKIHMSQQLVNYKIKQFHEKGVIQSSYPFVDYSKLGYLTFRVFFKIIYKNKNSFHRLLHKLGAHPNVIEILECGGKYDVIVVFAAKNPSSFNKILKEIIYEHPEMKDYLILTTVVMHTFPRKHLINLRQNKEDIITGGDRIPETLDETDKKILRSLNTDGTKPITEIATNSQISPKTVLNRIRNLEKKEILLSFHPVLNFSLLDYKVNKIFLSYHNLSRQREQQLIGFCMTNPHIISAIKLFGGWDIEITLETQTMREFRNVYNLLRETFQDIIKDVESFPIYHTHKQQSIPGEFFADLTQK